MLDTLSDWCQSRNKTLTELAVAWVLAKPGISTAIVGLKTSMQVKEVISAANWRLTKDEMKDIALITNHLEIKWVKDIH